MKRDLKKYWIVVLAVLSLVGSISLAQSQPPEKSAPDASPQKKAEPEKKADKEAAPPKKKMKKVQTLFGETWVEDTGEPEGGTPAKTAVPPTPPSGQPGQPAAVTPSTPVPETPPGSKITGTLSSQEQKQPTASEKKKGTPTAPPAQQAVPPVAATPGSTPARTANDAAPGSTPARATNETAPASAPIGGASLVFNNADLVQVVQVIANLLHLNYVMDPSVKGSVTITTLGDISSADLMQILQEILRINGYTAIQSGNIWQIIPLKSAHQIPVPLQSPDGKPLSPDDQMVTEIVPMQFVTSADMSRILKEFLSDAGSIVSYDRGNILILTDASRNMARLLDLVRTFDSDTLADQRVRLFPVKNNSARALIVDLRNIFAAYAMSDKESAIRFVSIDRLNAILAVAPNPASFKAVEQWVEKLDQPSQVAGIRNYVYHVQYAKASNIEKLLAQLYGSVINSSETPGIPRNETSATGSLTSGSGATGLSQSTAMAQASRPDQSATSTRDVYGFQGNIKVVADELNNMLIIQATPQDYDLIDQTLRQIDVLPRQVLIEAQIFRVDLSHDFSLGVEYTLQQRGTAAGGTKPLASFTSGVFSGSSVIMNAGARELFTRVTATENRSRTKTLSSPSILATDNQEARIQVGITIPTLSSSGFQPAANNVIFNTVQNVDTGVILSVTPHVSANGLVGMKITQEVSSPVPPPAGVSNISPSINRSSASTSFIVRDGETVAIAGIITEDKELTRSRIPVLGDIPILGAAFGSTGYANKRSELIIFITPHVVTTLDQEQVVTDALKDAMKKLKGDIRSNEKEKKRIWEKVQ